ncbi:NB-ARC domain-containing protein [Ideonella sp. DXS22W]|uniref:NB-ARC domain-containing protein n=1 Tax=Pseudaquabacterium inlustre TaxID=2984192 RepID=A0ABU9CLH4_9BURK
MSEVRTLLLTDVVDSTQLSQQLGDSQMARIWAAHDRAARDLLPRWRGREIDKTDGMLLLFDGVGDALGYAQAYHQALQALPVPLRARAGIHTGAVLLRENSADDVARGAKPLEVEGLAKPTAARVMSLAQGGQVLLTPPARDALLAAGGGPGLALRSCGHWVMKGLSEPLEVFEASPPGAALPDPVDSDKVYRVVRSGERWLPVREIPNNLPQPVTSFVGRERELDELQARLGQARLITLLGMGGLGKTRLALQLAQEVRHRFPDGVWFIDLSPLRDGGLVVAQAAQVLNVREEAERPLLHSLIATLRSRRLLLVIDNCEHLLEAAGDLIDELLRAVPQLSVLASSREPLDLPGEHSFPIQPLPLPGAADDLAALGRSTAVRLFIDRAQAHRPDFALRPDEAATVAQLVARLEGIPLAIELAAARLRTLEVAEIHAGLAQRFELLAGGSRRIQARHQAMRSLVDWSYELLTPSEQALLQRLSVFAGGFDTEAAEAVCGAAPIAPAEVPALLASLADKSLLARLGPEASARLRMLETIRDYAREKLDAADDAAPSAARHAQHFFGLAKQARDGLKGPDQPLWIGRLESDLDNVRAAITLALDGGVDPFIAVKMAVALQGFWALRGYAGEGRAVVAAALALPAVQASDLARAHALYVGAVLAGYQGDHAQARQMLEDCLALRRRSGQPVEVAAALSSLSMAVRHGGDVAAAAAHEREALALFRSIGDRIGEAIGLQHLGEYAMAQGEAGPAREHLAQGLALARQIGHREVEAECERMLGELAFELGDVARARGHFEHSLALCLAAADQRNEANALRWLGRADLAAGDVAAAAPRLAQAITRFQASEMRDELLACLEDHAALAQRLAQPRMAAQLGAAVDHLRDRLALTRPAMAQQRWVAWLQALQTEMPPDERDAAQLEGRRWDSAEAVRVALALRRA